MAMVCGFWKCYESRPPDSEIEDDLFDFISWVAEVCRNIEPSDVQRVYEFALKQVKRE